MKIFTIQIFILLFLIQSVVAQTDTVYIDSPGIVGGTWTPDNRYIARWDVSVPYDSVLTIQPGVKIEIQEGFAFKIEGQLNAVGNASNLIEISSYDESWKGVSFGTPSGEQDVNTSLLSFVKIDCGGFLNNSVAVLLGKHNINSLNNLKISNAEKAIRITGFATIDNIINCEFDDVSQGVVFQYCDFVSEVQIEDCNFENIRERAIVIAQNQAFLESIVISSCEFDNSALENNLSESAVYITLNEMLISVTLNDNNFKSFSWQDDSPACIYIFNNIILDDVSLNRNDIEGCGGESATSPNADFGGLYINHSTRVFMDSNGIEENTGKKSGGAYLNAEQIYFSDNVILNNRNNYTGTENFAGAMTIHVSDRVEFAGDRIGNNISAKSGGAMYIESLNGSDPIDLLLDDVTLSSNSASNEGGAVLINSALDTLGISNSTIAGNFSSAGSGGCLSIITSAFNDLTIASNTIQDNFVSDNSDGGFLYLRHNPSLIPTYGNISLDDNICSVTDHIANSNYNLIYSEIKSFPQSISISGDNVTDYYPVIGYLYHFGLLQSGPDPSEENVQLSFTGNEYQGNKCPLFFISNDYASLSVLSSDNSVNGDVSSFGTYLTLECQEANSLIFQHEDYFNLISGSSGGAVSVNTVNEIGYVNLQDVISHNCYSIEGDGGHFSLTSGNSDPAMEQSLLIIDSEFSNAGINNSTYGNGGAINYQTPGLVDTVLIRYSDFMNLNTDGSGGALYIDTKEILEANLEGSDFEDIYCQDGDGAVCLYAENGNINSISLLPWLEENTDFNTCYSHTDGGAISARASGEIGKVRIESISSVNCQSSTGNGGHFSFVSQGTVSSLTQDLIISNSLFDNTGAEPSGNQGGAVYFTSPQNLDSLSITASSFENFSTLGDGGELFINAKEISLVNIRNSVFSSGHSIDSGGGALYLNASNGNIEAIDLFNIHFSNCNAKLDGGVAYIQASREIGSIHIDSLESIKSYSSDGNGGHIAFISGGNDPALDQEFTISNSTFDNAGITNVIGGNGGAIYYYTPVGLNAFEIYSSSFNGMKAGEKAGAICAITRETGNVSILGSSFSSNSSLDSAGAIYLNASNGNIGNLWFAPYDNVPTTFSSCNSKYDGGAFCAIASKEIGMVALDSVEIEKCYAHEGSGGHGSIISLGADQAVVQELTISGSTFSNQGISNITGVNGGILYYSAFSDVANIMINGSSFTNPRAREDGGSLCIKAGKINSFDISSSLFSSSASEMLSGGAVYVKTINGLIDGNVEANRFINCTSGLMGGSVFVEDSKYDNTIENITYTGNTYRIEDVDDMPGTGGAVYCKGINKVTFVSDSVISQSASGMGGFVYLEKVYRSTFDSVYTYNNTGENGGVIYHKGDAETSFSQSTRIFNSTFLFNSAEISGGCFYITDIDSVEIGKEGFKNTFISNQSLSEDVIDQVGGGALYVQNSQQLDINYNYFYVNTSKNNGGIGIVSNVSSGLLIEGNTFLSNQAKAGGTFAFINSFGNGIISDNNFSYNSTSEQAGALLFSPSVMNSFLVNDNTFYKNTTGKLGGAIASYRPVRLIRNLFRENKLVDVNPGFNHKGTTVYLSGEGDLTVIKNCVFDQNKYKEVPAVASVYFDATQAALPAFSIANCSFFNFSDEHLSIYNANGQDTIRIENSIFTQRENVLRDDSIIYFNETVKSRYCDLIYSQINDSIDHNYDEYIYFNIGAYYFDSTQYPVNQGNPDASFNDFHFPLAYDELTNDLGMSGGPDNPDSNGVFLIEEPVDPPNKFTLVVTRDCFTFTFKCVGEFVETYDTIYWFMPDSIYKTIEPEFTYTFSSDLYGVYSITALGQDVNNADVYGYGQYDVNLDIIRIISLSTDDGSNTISVPSVPFNFSIEAIINVQSDIDYTWEWTIVNSQGVEYAMTVYELLNMIEIQKITSLPASITIKYSLEACGRVEDSTITIEFLPANQWGYPEIIFSPEPGVITCETYLFKIEFDKVMIKANGDSLMNNDLDNFIVINDNPNCAKLTFNKTVNYQNGKTIFNIEPVSVNTMQPEFLCNGDYTFDVKCSELFTLFYNLSHNDTNAIYKVVDVNIDEIPITLEAAVYPNPFRNFIHVDFETRDDYYFEVSNLQGQVQKTGKFADVSEVTLNLTTLSDGFYILYMVNSRKTERFYLKINKITY